MRPFPHPSISPYVCPRCRYFRTRWKRRSPLPRSFSATASLQDDQSSKFAKLRIRELGNEEQLSGFYPRWKVNDLPLHLGYENVAAKTRRHEPTSRRRIDVLKDYTASLKAGESNFDVPITVTGMAHNAVMQIY